ncbi:MAG: hypothetical protein JNL43_16875 [Flavobacteriales bacterium]|nr:hypothetical protein [Flavobacteriales bacterium]
MSSRRVDVAINVYGKPHQTAVTLLSLLQHSGEHIGRIHITVEKRQPFGAEFGALLRMLGDRATTHSPRFWFGVRPQRSKWLMRWRPYRHALRYQHAWETSDMPYLFITHNDVLYSGDIIGAMLQRVSGNIAIGPVGQCWNCPASLAGSCSPERFMTYRPSYAEWERLARQHPGPRAAHYDRVVDPAQPWPLPECRVNEWTMMVDLEHARPLTMPNGNAVPLGALYGLDIGTQWFHDVLNAGASIAHFDIAPYARHAWASSSGSGHAALSDRAEYDRAEAEALVRLQEKYPHYAALLTA